MSAAYTSYPPYTAYASMPMPVGKSPHVGYYQGYQGYQGYPAAAHGAYGRVPASPPEAPESVSSSGVPSYDPSAASSSYAGSSSDYDASAPGSGVDLLEYMNDRLSNAYNPIPLDQSLVRQAQTSGELNAKTRELLELQAMARSRLAAAQSNFSEGMKAAKETQRDLEWTQKRVSSINQRAARKYPQQYAMASQRYPAPVDY